MKQGKISTSVAKRLTRLSAKIEEALMREQVEEAMLLFDEYNLVFYEEYNRLKRGEKE